MAGLDDPYARRGRVLQNMSEATDRWQRAMAEASRDSKISIEEFDSVTDKLEEAFEEMSRAIEAAAEHADNLDERRRQVAR